jgi:hypothetical protein
MNGPTQQERWKKTNICRLDYQKPSQNLPVTVEYFNEITLLSENERLESTNPDFRLYVVEDLSRDVIEYLGKRYDIEPDFFREHILDFAWSNVRDFWRNPPNLVKESRQRRWTQVRFVTARYFETPRLFQVATKEASGWNVLRRPDNDGNDKVSFDKEGSIVSLIRTRASFWHRPGESQGEKGIGRTSENCYTTFFCPLFANIEPGVLLLDPTLKTGFPLWRGRRNWERTPGIGQIITAAGVQERPNGEMNLFDDFICWARRPELFSSLSPQNCPGGQSSNFHVPIQVILHLISSEWLTLGDYIKTRLTQIEWEIAFPENFIKGGNQIDGSLKRLHMWRRFVPLYCEMLSEALEGIFHFPCHDEAASAGSCGCIGEHGQAPSPPPSPYHVAAVYRRDFILALSSMKGYQKRIDRLTSVITAVISIKDSHRALEDSKNIGRLSWLATFFLPYSITASIFAASAVKDITTERVGFYFEVAAPLALVTILLAYLLTLPQVHRLVHCLLVKLRVVWVLKGLHLLPEEESE